MVGIVVQSTTIRSRSQPWLSFETRRRIGTLQCTLLKKGIRERSQGTPLETKKPLLWLKYLQFGTVSMLAVITILILMECTGIRASISSIFDQKPFWFFSKSSQHLGFPGETVNLAHENSLQTVVSDWLSRNVKRALCRQRSPKALE